MLFIMYIYVVIINRTGRTKFHLKYAMYGLTGHPVASTPRQPRTRRGISADRWSCELWPRTCIASYDEMRESHVPCSRSARIFYLLISQNPIGGERKKCEETHVTELIGFM